MSEVRYSLSPEAFKKYTTEDIRKEFLIPEVMQKGKITAVYSLYDRMVTMGAVPTNEAIELPVYEELTKAEYFLQRREMGIINVGGSGKVTVDGEVYELANKECLYIGRAAKNVTFVSNYAESPAQYFINSSPAHKEYPTTKATLADANEVNLGSKENCNERTIYQFIHEGGIQSCQLVMGFTTLKTGSIWNTFPPHTHLRRMEVYLF